MACCGCCRPSKGTQLGWSIAASVLGAGVVGATVWALLASDGVRENVKCLVDGFGGMKSLVDEPPACSAACTGNATCTCIDWSPAQAAFDAFPSTIHDIVDIVKAVVGLWTVVLVVPGAALGGLALFVALLTCLAERNHASPGMLVGCTRLWNTAILGVVLWTAALVFAVAAVAGFGARVGQVNTMYEDTVTKPCQQEAAAIANLVAESQTNFEDMGCAAPPGGFEAMCTEAQTQITHAGEISTEFTALCNCAGDVLESAAPLAIPGAAGLGLSLLLVVAHWGVCATMGCCAKYRPACKSESFGGSFDASADPAGHPLLKMRI